MRNESVRESITNQDQVILRLTILFSAREVVLPDDVLLGDALRAVVFD
jgi:hypothetical protein